MPKNLVDFLRGVNEHLITAKSVVIEGKSILRRSHVNLPAPITNPDKILFVGLNDRSHWMNKINQMRCKAIARFSILKVYWPIILLLVY